MHAGKQRLDKVWSALNKRGLDSRPQTAGAAPNPQSALRYNHTDAEPSIGDRKSATGKVVSVVSQELRVKQREDNNYSSHRTPKKLQSKPLSSTHRSQVESARTKE